jgi:dCMP deaminase
MRLDWDDYFLEVARTVASRATCDRGKCGCVIVRDKQILVTGYVGAPRGLPHCDDVGHLMKKVVHEDGHESNHCVRTVHAEQNAICQAAKLGISIDGATLYCKMTPCSVCAMLLINCGVKQVVCQKRYHAGASDMLVSAGVVVRHLDDSVEEYSNQ